MLVFVHLALCSRRFSACWHVSTLGRKVSSSRGVKKCAQSMLQLITSSTWNPDNTLMCPSHMADTFRRQGVLTAQIFWALEHSHLWVLEGSRCAGVARSLDSQVTWHQSVSVTVASSSQLWPYTLLNTCPQQQRRRRRRSAKMNETSPVPHPPIFECAGEMTGERRWRGEEEEGRKGRQRREGRSQKNKQKKESKTKGGRKTRIAWQRWWATVRGWSPSQSTVTRIRRFLIHEMQFTHRTQNSSPK